MEIISPTIVIAIIMPVIAVGIIMPTVVIDRLEALLGSQSSETGLLRLEPQSQPAQQQR